MPPTTTSLPIVDATVGFAPAAKLVDLFRQQVHVLVVEDHDSVRETVDGMLNSPLFRKTMVSSVEVPTVRRCSCIRARRPWNSATERGKPVRPGSLTKMALRSRRSSRPPVFCQPWVALRAIVDLRYSHTFSHSRNTRWPAWRSGEPLWGPRARVSNARVRSRVARRRRLRSASSMRSATRCGLALAPLRPSCGTAHGSRRNAEQCARPALSICSDTRWSWREAGELLVGWEFAE